MSNAIIGTLSLYEIFAYFFFYAFLGWIAEVCYHAVTCGDFSNRGFLNGPLCPIYGCGVTLILLILGEWAEKPWAVLLTGIALPTLLELVGGWSMEKFFHNKWWDYSDRKFNFKGYICLEFSVLWGLAAVCVICVVHPGIKRLVNLIPEPYATVLIGILLAAFIADAVVTLLQLCKLNGKLKELDEINKAMRVGSDAIGKKIAQASLAVGEKTGKLKDKLDKKHEQAIDALVEKMPKRLLKAFPTLKSHDHPDAVPLAKTGLKRISLRKRKRQGNETVIGDETKDPA